MLETTTEPRAMHVYRVLTAYDDTSYEESDGSTVDMLAVWVDELGRALRQAADDLGENESGWLVRGVLRIDDVREIDILGGWVVVTDPGKVKQVDRIFLPAPIRESALALVREFLGAAERDLAGFYTDEDDEDDAA